MIDFSKTSQQFSPTMFQPQAQSGFLPEFLQRGNFTPSSGSAIGAAAPSGGGGFINSFLNNIGLDQETQMSLFGGTDAATGNQSLGIIPGIMGAATGIGQTWLGMQNLGLAKDQLNFTKQAYQQNLANQIKEYNTRMEDRLRGRTSDYQGKEEDIQREMDKRGLKE